MPVDFKDQPLPSLEDAIKGLVDQHERKLRGSLYLNAEFVAQINKVGATLADDVFLKNLRIPSDSTLRTWLSWRREEYATNTNPHPEWKQLLDSLDPAKRGAVVSAIGDVIDRRYQTVGELRATSLSHLMNPEEPTPNKLRVVTADKPVGYRPVRPIRAVFLKYIFAPIVNPQSPDSLLI